MLMLEDWPIKLGDEKGSFALVCLDSKSVLL